MSQDNNNCQPNCPCGQYKKGVKKHHTPLPDPERKPAWEWFDNVQKKIATEPKLVVKRRGKKHKW
jgi:hypothetical protein